MLATFSLPCFLTTSLVCHQLFHRSSIPPLPVLTCTGQRQFDITCCDMEPAILGKCFCSAKGPQLISSTARNILLYTLLFDDEKCVNDIFIWNIYYHLRIDVKSLKLLQDQSRKLLQLAASSSDWHRFKYSWLRFCDEGTLAQVRDAWSSHHPTDTSAKAQMSHKTHISASLDKAKSFRSQYLGNKSAFDGLRSTAPLGLQGIEDLPILQKAFWKNGTTDQTAVPSGDLHSNPMFVPATRNMSTLHYGTDPYLGFHLATGYTKLESSSPLNSQLRSKNGRQPLVDAAKLEFRA